MTFADGSGQSLAYLDMDYLANTFARVIQTHDGRWAAYYDFEMPGLSVIPDELMLCFDDASLNMTCTVQKQKR